MRRERSLKRSAAKPVPAGAPRARWLKNRPAAPELFELELGAVLSTLMTTPIMGKVYEADVGFPVRRVLLKKTATHVYFGLNGDELVVLSVWGARRRRGPKL